MLPGEAISKLSTSSHGGKVHMLPKMKHCCLPHPPHAQTCRLRMLDCGRCRHYDRRRPFGPYQSLVSGAPAMRGGEEDEDTPTLLPADATSSGEMRRGIWARD